MKITVDTNILVRAGRDDDLEQTPAARRLLSDASVVFIPVMTLCEYVWVMRRHYKRPRREVHASLLALVSGANVVTDDDAVAAGLAFLDRGGDFADGVIAHDGRRLGGEVFASFDATARKIAAALGFEVLPV